MFEFNFDHLTGFLIAYIPALLNLGIVLYIYLYLPENRLTNVFALLGLTLAGWQINDSVARISTSAAMADQWDVILCIFWIFVGPLYLHFALLYFEILKKGHSRVPLLFLYVPGIIFMLLYQGHLYPHIFKFDEVWGWVNYHNQHWLDILQLYWIAGMGLGATAIFFYRCYYVRNDKLLKYQTILITAGIAVPSLVALFGQFLYPIILHKPSLPLASTFMTLFSLTTVISLNKYRLFSATDLVNNDLLIEDMPIMVFSISEKNRLTYMNKYGADVLGIRRKEIGMLTLENIFHFGSKERENNFFNALRSSLEGNMVNEIESSFISTKGKIDILMSCKPIVNNSQIHGVLFAARDITELKKSNELMRSNEVLFEDAQQMAHIGSWEWDIQADEVSWSEELFRIYGYEPGEIDLNFRVYLDHAHPDDREQVKNIILDSYSSRKPFTFYYRIFKKDGTEVMLHGRGKVDTDENNKPVKMSGTAQDVTEEKNKEEVLKRQNEELKKINHELDKFVYSVSHDLRAPLLSMQGVVDIIAKDTREEMTSEYIKMLQSCISHLDNFIRDILEYSRNARFEIKNDTIHFNELLGKITGELKFMAGSTKSVDISILVNEKQPFISDKSRLSIVLSNLISNAIRYQNPESEKPFIAIHVATDEMKAVITVEDNGIGISKDYHDKIFEMFYRHSESSNGSGLGLYIVKETIENLKGSIAIESELGKGTRFTIMIPNSAAVLCVCPETAEAHRLN